MFALPTIIFVLTKTGEIQLDFPPSAMKRLQNRNAPKHNPRLRAANYIKGSVPMLQTTALGMQSQGATYPTLSIGIFVFATLWMTAVVTANRRFAAGSKPSAYEFITRHTPARHNRRCVRAQHIGPRPQKRANDLAVQPDNRAAGNVSTPQIPSGRDAPSGLGEKSWSTPLDVVSKCFSKTRYRFEDAAARARNCPIGSVAKLRYEQQSIEPEHP